MSDIDDERSVRTLSRREQAAKEQAAHLPPMPAGCAEPCGARHNPAYEPGIPEFLRTLAD